jgi:3D (Asp-Asp-Asp) domain-containing protein
MGKRTLSAIFAVVAIAATGCAAGTEDDATDTGAGEALSSGSTKSFVAKGTAYFPSNSGVEGGFVDRKGAKLQTLQQFLAGSAKYVSVAMDSKAFPYGQRLRIAELNKKYGQDIVFEVVDTGGDFVGKGTSRIDICVASQKDSTEPTVNGTLHIDAIASNAPTVPVPTSTSTPSKPPPSTSGSSGSSGSSGGAACSSDGACNPGNDGSGLICVSHQCVPGCHSDAQCPGVSSCQSGQCL